MKEPSDDIIPKKDRRAGSVLVKAPWTFPQNTLEQAIEIPKAIEQQNAGNPMKSDILAKAVGFNKPDWRYSNLLKSANLYGMVSGAGAAATVSMTPTGNDVIAPGSPSRFACFGLWSVRIAGGKSGAKITALQTLRDCVASARERGASGVRRVYRRF